MPTHVSEGLRDIKFMALEPLAIDPRAACYPYPQLQKTSRRINQQFVSLVLENDYSRIEILPELGGRVVSWLDKKSQRHVLQLDDPLELADGGPRGVQSSFGIQLTLDGRERAGAMASVDWSLEEPEEENESAAVWIADHSSWPMSFHVRYQLPPDRAELLLEARIFNRSLRSCSYNGGLLVGRYQEAFELEDRTLLWNESSQVGIEVKCDDLGFASFDAEVLTKSRFSGARRLAPHQLDAWSTTIVAHHGERPHPGEGLSIALTDGEVRVRASRDLPTFKLVVLGKRGESLEASLSAAPGEEIALSLPEIDAPPQAAVVLDSNRKEILRVDLRVALSPLAHHPFERGEEAHSEPTLSATASHLRDWGFSLGNRAVACMLLSLQSIREGDFAEADSQLEQVLSFNADNHLAWWLKARCAALISSEPTEATELLNAHFLAPLDPVLRAEAFLTQPVQPGKESNPLLKSLATRPELLIEVAVRLLEARLLVDASRWLDECLRWVDLPLLRYLLAYGHLIGTKMEAEAAEHIAAAGRLEFQPPYPVRPIEHEALTALSLRFPNDERLTQYAELLVAAE